MLYVKYLPHAGLCLYICEDNCTCLIYISHFHQITCGLSNLVRVIRCIRGHFTCTCMLSTYNKNNVVQQSHQSTQSPKQIQHKIIYLQFKLCFRFWLYTPSSFSSTPSPEMIPLERYIYIPHNRRATLPRTNHCITYRITMLSVTYIASNSKVLTNKLTNYTIIQ